MCDALANKLFLKKQYFRTEIKEGEASEAHEGTSRSTSSN